MLDKLTNFSTTLWFNDDDENDDENDNDNNDTW